MKRILLFALAVITACQSNDYWADSNNWFQTGNEINENYTDVIYFVSTNIVESRDAGGRESARALLGPDERAALIQEIDYIHKTIYSDSLNYFAPIYHQVTMNSFLNLELEDLDPQIAATEQECLQAFNYYMANFNNGRPYILAGFSQGAMMVKSLVKNMTDSQLEQMVAAYVIGFELTEEDLNNPHIIPAKTATDTGVTISYNSVMTPDSIWPLVCTAPATCINPVNWCTDQTPATLWDGDIQLSAAVDTTYNVVVVSGYQTPPVAPFPEPWPSGNLHHQEILIYAPTLHRNALDRAY